MIGNFATLFTPLFTKQSGNEIENNRSAGSISRSEVFNSFKPFRTMSNSWYDVRVSEDRR